MLDKLKEHEIQQVLFKSFSSGSIVIPNLSVDGFERDLVLITNARFYYEYEIKCTRSDFKADIEHKKYKHSMFVNEAVASKFFIPKRFYYVCQGDIVTVADLPEYAGLIKIYWNMKYLKWDLNIIKKAPSVKWAKKLSKEKMDYILIRMSDLIWADKD